MRFKEPTLLAVSLKSPQDKRGQALYRNLGSSMRSATFSSPGGRSLPGARWKRRRTRTLPPWQSAIRCRRLHAPDRSGLKPPHAIGATHPSRPSSAHDAAQIAAAEYERVLAAADRESATDQEVVSFFWNKQVKKRRSAFLVVELRAAGSFADPRQAFRRDPPCGEASLRVPLVRSRPLMEPSSMLSGLNR